MLETCRLPAELLAVRPVADDDEVGSVVPPEELDQRLHAFEPLQPTDEEEVRPFRRVSPSTASRRRGAEVGQVAHRAGEAARAVRFDREAARSEEEIDVTQLALEQRRSARAAAAGGRRACSAGTAARSHGSRLFLQSVCIGQTSQCSCVV